MRRIVKENINITLDQNTVNFLLDALTEFKTTKTFKLNYTYEE